MGPDQTEIITIEELATILKVKKSWIYSQTHLGKGIPHFRCGRQLRFVKNEVMKYFQSAPNPTQAKIQ